MTPASFAPGNWPAVPARPGLSRGTRGPGAGAAGADARQDGGKLPGRKAPSAAEAMRELTRLKRTGLAGALLADHRLFHLEADLRWIDLTSARLAEQAETVRVR